MSVSAGKPEHPNPLDAVWAAILNLQTQASWLWGNITQLKNNLQTQASWLWGNITQLKNTDSTLQGQIDTKQSSAPDYDSGWIDISNMAGKYKIINHNLDTTNTRVYITGKTTADGGMHQRYFGLVNPGERASAVSYKPYGGASRDYGSSVVQTSDGGYAILGTTESYGAGAADVWLIKTDAAGTPLWNQTYGGASADFGLSVVQTWDGGYTILGTTESYGAGLLDVWLIKTDAAGTHLWNQTYGGASSDYGSSMVRTWDGGYAIVGSTESYGAGAADVWLIKTNATGNHLWNQTFGGANGDGGFSVVWDWAGGGGYAIAGYTTSYGAGATDVWLIKTDAAGTPLWNQTYGGASDDYGFSVVQTRDGGYAIVGYTASYYAGSDLVWLIKTDIYGNKIWDRIYGGANLDRGSTVVQTSDGGYAIGGTTESYGAGSLDMWLVQFNPNGESGLAWTYSTDNTITLYRGFEDRYWNYVRVQIWDLD